MKLYTKKEAINEGIKLIIGQTVKKGKVVAAKSDRVAYTFDHYEGDQAVCLSVDNKEKRFNKNEIFDANKLLNVCQHLYNFGFWKEGMEGKMITIG